MGLSKEHHTVKNGNINTSKLSHKFPMKSRSTGRTKVLVSLAVPLHHALTPGMLVVLHHDKQCDGECGLDPKWN
jgi:hypothetical protein